MREVESNGMLGEYFCSDRHSLQSKPGFKDDGCRRGKKPEIRCSVQDPEPVLVVVQLVLNMVKEQQMNPEKADSCPACKPVHLFPHVMVACP